MPDRTNDLNDEGGKGKGKETEESPHQDWAAGSSYPDGKNYDPTSNQEDTKELRALVREMRTAMKYLKLVNGPDGSPQGISFYTEQGDQEDHVSAFISFQVKSLSKISAAVGAVLLVAFGVVIHLVATWLTSSDSGLE